jgi:hypothetical protein
VPPLVVVRFAACVGRGSRRSASPWRRRARRRSQPDCGRVLATAVQTVTSAAGRRYR